VEPVVKTESGRVQGQWEEESAVFLGIPYAEAPVGPHRLGPPAPRRAWDGVRPALHYGPTAPQPAVDFTIIPEPVIAGEDCLSLNIFTPDPSPTAALPVMVWIHGGGFVTGCSASPWYRGTRFARDGVVVVSINYRLGAEGFLRVEGAPDNRGALDWAAALEWVQANIAGFGGDASRVTVAGQSAGAVACLGLMAMPGAAGLFGGVIAMSGAALFNGAQHDATSQAEAVAGQLGCRPTREDLGRFSPEELVAAQAGAGAGGLGALGLFIDGEVLPSDPVAAIAQGTGGSLPLLLGTTQDEAVPAIIGSADRIDPERFARRMGRLGLSETQAGAYRQLMPEGPLWRVLARASGDRMFRLPAARLADVRAVASGNDGSAGAPGASTYAYEFRWPSPALGGFGACHCLDLPFVFDNLDAHWVETVAGAETPQGLADNMHAAWVSFVSRGDPGWAAYNSDRRPVMTFDGQSALVEDPLGLERAIWSSGD